MAVYINDCPTLFKKALESVDQNTLTPDEIILVCDGPLTDELEEVIIHFEKKNNNLKCIRLKSNQGLANALNIGLEHARHEFILRADSDDINMPNRFEKQIKILNEGYDLISSDIEEIDEDGNHLSFKRLPYISAEILRYAKKRSPFNHPSTAFRKTIVKQAGGYPEIHLKEDYALWAKILSKGAKIMNSSDILVKATTGKSMFERRGGLKYALAELELQTLLVNLKQKTLLSGVLDFFGRAFIFLLPNKIRSFIYYRLLRK